MKRIFTVIAAAGILSTTGASVSAQDAKAQKGMQVFTAQKCTACHSIAGKGSKKGPLDDVGSKLSPAEIREWIVDPVGMTAKANPKPTRKPPMKKKALAPDDVDALVTLLANLKG
jgi:mono/diheme cytochrome c family protein